MISVRLIRSGKTSGINKNAFDGPQWKPIVSVTGKEKGDQEFVRISLFRDSSGEVGGLAIFALEPDEVALVNMVGKVRLDQLVALGQILGKQAMLGIPAGKSSLSGTE